MDIEDHVDKMNVLVTKLNNIQGKIDDTSAVKNDKSSQKPINELWTNSGKDFKGINFIIFILLLLKHIILFQYKLN